TNPVQHYCVVTIFERKTGFHAALARAGFSRKCSRNTQSPVRCLGELKTHLTAALASGCGQGHIPGTGNRLDSDLLTMRWCEFMLLGGAADLAAGRARSNRLRRRQVSQRCVAGLD